MSEVKLQATVRQGKLVPEAPTVWAVSLGELEGKRVSVTLTTERVRRSTQANRFHWGCVVPVFQEIWSRGRIAQGLPPYTAEETHGVLVEVLVGCEEGPLTGSRVRKRTSDMDKAAFAAFVDAARQLALQQYRVYISEPGEVQEYSA